MAKKKSKTKNRKGDKSKGKNKKNQKGKRKERKSDGPKKKQGLQKVTAKSRGKKKKKKKPKGISWGPKGPKPVDPSSGRPKKNWPKKKKKKWPPKRKRPKGTGSNSDNDQLQFSDFAPHVGTFFQIVDFDPPVPIELIEVAELDEIDVPEQLDEEIRDQPFSLLFLGPVNIDVPQESYNVEHSSLEPMILFLVPVGPPASDGDYQLVLEAIFG